MEKKLLRVGVDEAEAEVATLVEGAAFALQDEEGLTAGFGGGDETLMSAFSGLSEGLHLVEHGQQEHDAASEDKGA